MPRKKQRPHHKWKTVSDVLSKNYNRKVMDSIFVGRKDYSGYFGEVHIKKMRIGNSSKYVAIKIFSSRTVRDILHKDKRLIAKIGNELVNELSTLGIGLPKMRYFVYEYKGKEYLCSISNSFVSENDTYSLRRRMLRQPQDHPKGDVLDQYGQLMGKLFNRRLVMEFDFAELYKNKDTGTLRLLPIDLDLLIEQRLHGENHIDKKLFENLLIELIKRHKVFLDDRYYHDNAGSYLDAIINGFLRNIDYKSIEILRQNLDKIEILELSKRFPIGQIDFVINKLKQAVFDLNTRTVA